MGIDIDLNVGDIRHPTSTSVIPISEENMSDSKLSYRYRKSPFHYRTNSISGIPISAINFFLQNAVRVEILRIDRTAGIGQLGQDSQDKTAEIEQPEQESRDKRTGQES